MITDAHVNLFPLPAPLTDPWPKLGGLLSVLGEAGISRAIACASGPVSGCSTEEFLRWNGLMAQLGRQHGGLVPAAIVHPSSQGEACPILRHCREVLDMRFVGELFDQGSGFLWPDPHYDNILGLAVELRMVPIIHCASGVARTIAERYPSGKFIIAHLATEDEPIATRLETIAGLENLFLGISGDDMGPGRWLRMAVEMLGPERVIFGSGWPAAMDPVIAVECVRLSGLPEKVQETVFNGAFESLLDWTDSTSSPYHHGSHAHAITTLLSGTNAVRQRVPEGGVDDPSDPDPQGLQQQDSPDSARSCKGALRSGKTGQTSLTDALPAEHGAAMAITDAQTHLFHLDPPPPVNCPALDEHLAILSAAGVTRVLAGPGWRSPDLSAAEYIRWNDLIAESCAKQACVIPAAAVHTSLQGEACDVLRYCHEELGMRFTQELFDRWAGFSWPDPYYDMILELAVELRMVPVIHCENEVARIIGERYPEGRFIIPHLATTYESLASRLETLAGLENLFLNICGHQMSYRGWVRQAVETLGPERVLFGSDWGAALDPVIAVECVRRSGIPEQSQRSVFDGTFQRLMDWTNP
ncbi:MAG: amidohydrolase family protein [Armatimonadia bacterium]